MTRIFLRQPGIPHDDARRTLRLANVQHIAKKIYTDPRFLTNLNNHATVFIVFNDRSDPYWLNQVHDLLQPHDCKKYWFNQDAVRWSSRHFTGE